MLSSFFIMLCRNSVFDAMGIYTKMKKNVLYPVFTSMFDEEISDDTDEESRPEKDENTQMN
ncbi:MAG: hypothetical protein UH963_00540 [Agathobacter sp.]|nr:hypothetical protein [Agathobacter sp.]